MERAIGEVFELDGVKLRVDAKFGSCNGCYFIEYGLDCVDLFDIRFSCMGFNRIDSNDIIFTEVKE